MKIAIVSGKGGTGKTTIATNLAVSLARAGQTVQYLDCDVEEPNGHIFLKPVVEETHRATMDVPQVNQTFCKGCGKCSRFCQFSAIVCLKGKAHVFAELCHSCGGCMQVCPTGAIWETSKEIGFVDLGSANGIAFAQGRLNIGDLHTPSLIQQVKAHALSDGIVIIDAPPGTSCPVIEAVKGNDFVVIVTEPTPFGLNDLQLTVGTIRALNLPFAVVVNCSNSDESIITQYCREENIEILLEVPEDRRIAEAYSLGWMIIDVLPEYQSAFTQLYENVSTNHKYQQA